MSEITREHALFNIKTVLNIFVNKLENAKEYIDYLSSEGKEIVQAYESDKDDCKTLLFAAKENEEFFEGLSDENIIEYANICYELNKLFGLRVKNLYKVTKIKDCGEYKLICEERGLVSLPCSKDFSIVKINEKKVNFLTVLIKRVDWQLLDSREKVLDEMSFKDITDLNPFTRTIEFPDKGTYTVRAKIYTEGLFSETLTDVLDYKQTINGAEVNLSLYDKSWIVVKNESGQIEKIIFNEGNGITFVNRYGEVIEKIPFDSSISKTKFLDKHLGVEDSNKILINAHYTYNKDKGVFEEGNGAKRCFDLEGNDAPFEFNTRPINGKKKIKTKTPAVSETNMNIPSERQKLQQNIQTNSTIVWNRDTMVKWKAVAKKDKTGNETNECEKTSCSDFLPVYLKSLGDNVAMDVLGEENYNSIFKNDQTVVANNLIDFFSSNSMLALIKGNEININEKEIPNTYKTDDKNFKASDKISASKKAIIAQKYANGGKLIIATTDGHVAVVVKSSNTYSCYPETRWKEDKNDPFLTGMVIHLIKVEQKRKFYTIFLFSFKLVNIQEL